jgi:hypothetical protein
MWTGSAIPTGGSAGWIWPRVMPQFGAGKPAPGAFFDSDFASIDSLLAVALLHGLQGKSDCRVAIVTMSRPNLAIAGFLDAVERFYRGPAGNFAQVPPIGMITTGSAGETPSAYTVPFQKQKPDGTPVYKNEVRSVIETGDPSTLLRNYLQAQYDQNGFVVLGGPATNLAAALDFPGLKDWIAAKVKYLVISGSEVRMKADLGAAKKVLAEWPTPVVLCGSEIGAALPFPGSSIDKEFAAAVPDNPVADAYRADRPMPYDIPSADMAAALYAARPKEGYFQVSPSGAISVGEDGRTSFAPSEKGPHQYLIFDPAQKEKILQAYVELASAKPTAPRRFRPAAVVQDPPPAKPKQ